LLLFAIGVKYTKWTTIQAQKKADNGDVPDNNNENSLQASKVSKENNQACKLHNLGTRIPTSTHKKLLQFAIIEYGKIHGAVSLIVTNAIESYIYKQQQTTSYTTTIHNKFGKPRTDVKEKYRLIASHLKPLTSYPLINVPTLKAVVKETLGKTDKRTFEKYLRTVARLSKEQSAVNGGTSVFDVTKFVEKIHGDDW